MKSGKEVAHSLDKGAQSFALFLCNPKQCTFLNRKPLNWVSIIFYYAIFYTFLLGFFLSLILLVMHVVIDEKVPYLTGQESFLEGNPGLGFLPKLEIPDGSQMSYTFNISNHKAYAKASEEVLSKYQNLPWNCDFESNSHSSGRYDEACNFPPRLLGPCQNPQLLASPDEGFCIYLKMNKVTSIPLKMTKTSQIFGYLPDISGEKILIDCFVASPLLAIHFQAPNKTTHYKCKYENMNDNLDKNIGEGDS
ncbi:hypothetical protein ACTXT7_012250 [Hymenolepis weldensis]